MAKRSRDVSFSPSADEAASETTTFSTDTTNLRTAKIAAYDTCFVHHHKHAMHCSLPPHSKSLEFSSLEDFEIHYMKEHTNRCVECGKNLPSDHLLGLHLDENHNPLREALAAKGEKTYSCFLPDCEKKCSSVQKRRLHLIDKHNFPKIYNFNVINQGIDHANTLLQEGRRRRVSLINEELSSNRNRVSSISQPTDSGDRDVTKETMTASSEKCTTITTTKLEGVQKGSEPVRNLSAASSPTNSNTIDDLEQSFAALHFVPRVVLSKRAKN